MELNIPRIGYGTYRLKSGSYRHISDALKCGYKMIDTAEAYGNESEIRRAISCSRIPREEIILSGKLWFPYRNAEESILRTCEKLGTEYLDIYLVHKPNSINPKEHLNAFKELERCREKGLVNAIGVTSFNLKELEQLVSVTGIIPDIVQAECHPFFQQKQLQQKVESLGSIFQAWFPLGSGDKNLFSNPVLKSIADKYEITVPNLILKWHMQEGHYMVVGSTNYVHMTDNLKVQEQMWNLSCEDMAQIHSLDSGKSYDVLPKWAQTLFFKSPLWRFV